MHKFFSALLLSVISLATIAADDPWFLLEKTAYAARELNYQGIFVYQNGKETHSVQITHMNQAGREMTRNVVLDNRPQPGQAREVYRHGENIVILRPHNQTMVIEKRRGQNLFPAMIPTNIQAIKASYVAELAGMDTIAGREAQIINLTPNDSYRYSYKIWADTQYGLLLKMALLDNKKQTLEHIAFNEINTMDTQDINWFQPKIDVTKQYVTKSYDMKDTSNHHQVHSNWFVSELPIGYVKVDHRALVVPGKTTTVDQMIFSDGIGSVSVFIEPLTKGMRPKMGHMQMGSTNMCANVIDGHQVNVVGEVPETTCRQIAKAVSLNKQTALNK
jgi:sigma-E factor negative regulatory protein RseB